MFLDAMSEKLAKHDHFTSRKVCDYQQPITFLHTIFDVCGVELTVCLTDIQYTRQTNLRMHG